MTPSEQVWRAWDTRVRGKRVLAAINLAMLGGFSLVFAVMSAGFCAVGGLMAGIVALAEATRGGDGAALALSVVILAVPIGGAVLVLATAILVVADPVRVQRAPALLVAGRIAQARFESGIAFGKGRMRWELYVIPEEAWELTPDRRVTPVAPGLPLVLRTMPGIGEQTRRRRGRGGARAGPPACCYAGTEPRA